MSTSLSKRPTKKRKNIFKWTLSIKGSNSLPWIWVDLIWNLEMLFFSVRKPGSLKKKIFGPTITLSLPESVMGTFKMVQSFESVDEILWCDHLNETSFYKIKFGICLDF